MSIVYDLGERELPQGFEASTVDINGKTADCAVSGDITLVYMKDDTGSGFFCIYSNGSFERYYELISKEHRYVFLNTDCPPDGFSPAELMISEAKIPAWKFDGEAGEFYLVYITEIEKYEPVFCIYDAEKGTVQRYVERVLTSEKIVEVPTEVVVEVAVTPEPTPTPSLISRITGDTGILAVVLVLAGAAVILIAVLIIVSARGGGSSGGKKRHTPAH